METLQHDEEIALVSLEGLSLTDVARFGESSVSLALRSILAGGDADVEAVALFSNQDGDGDGR